MNLGVSALAGSLFVFAVASSAGAQISVGGASLSGAYAVSSSKICQISNEKSGGNVTLQSSTMTFSTDPVTAIGMVTIKGSEVTGLGYLIPPITGSDFRALSVSKTAKFTLSNGTLKIGSVKYHVELASITNHALLAKSFTFSGIDGGCAVTGIGIAD